MRVLIAEDDPVSRRVLQSALLKWGYEVEIACDGREALERLNREDAPRLAVLDWMMPEVDGLRVCQALRKRDGKPYVYTILLTAKAQRDDILSGLQAGADDYLLKPFDPQELCLRLLAGRRVLDLQAQLISAREAVRLQAVTDPLTGLPNRLLFADRLSRRIKACRRNRGSIAVMFLDLDHFKAVNDTLGHNVGDHLLKEVAGRLSGALRDADTVARMGGDEFTIVLNEIRDATDAAVAANRVLDCLKDPFVLEGRELLVTGSLGIAVYPQDGGSVEALVRSADIAMYRAKQQGRNRFQMFADHLNAEAVERLNIGNALRRAPERNELALHYQMRLDLDTGITPGLEALIRWHHPEKGLLYPSSFMGIAEDTDLAAAVTSWVLEEACRQNKSWQDSGFLKMDVAVNVSPRFLHRAELVRSVENALARTGLDARYLSLEVTEAAVMHNPEHASAVLEELKQIGVGISIDDFGTGFSSLGSLKKLPIDAVKIDPSFVRNITTSRDDESVSGAIIAMAHGLGIKVVAEGVETIEQLEVLRQMGCDEVQGYFISRPVPANEVVHMLSEGRPPLANWVSLAA